MNFSCLILIAIALAAGATAETCPAGNYLLKSKVCMPCPKGSFQPRANRYACKPCPHNKIAAKAGSTKCTLCPKNTEPSEFKHRCICIKGSVKNKGKCQLCKPGTFFSSGPGYRSCSGCSSGYYQPDAGQLDCLECPTGSQSGFEAVECVTCAKGEEFDKNANKCVKCKAGETHDEYSGCIKCDKNRYKPKAGPGPCLPCPIGTHSRSGAKRCLPCPKGTVLLKTGKCGNCRAGWYFDNFSLKCSKCGFNQFTPHKNVRTSCYECSGKKFALEGATKCITCPKHKYLARDGTCRKCPQGSVHVRYDLKCQKCRVNEFTRGDMDYCESCPNRTYSYAGSTTCFTCPKNEALIIKKKDCGSCPRGWTYDSYEAKCTKCYEGSIKKERGIESCKSCPSGKSNKKRTECLPN